MQVVDELFVCRTGNTSVGCCVRDNPRAGVTRSLNLNTVVDCHLMIEGITIKSSSTIMKKDSPYFGFCFLHNNPTWPLDD